MKKSSAILFIIFFCIGYHSGHSQNSTTKVIDYRQITTHPDIDLSPRISPDGKYMAYVSRISGNFDIWIQSTTGGRGRQLTTHKADEYYPAWDPKGKALYFVSQRSDAAGDIWRIKLRNYKGQLLIKDEPERITEYLGFDGYPSISPDGKKVAFVSDRSGQEEIWFYNYNNNLTAQLTFQGGTHPCWSSVPRFIAFTSFRADSKNNGDIWIMDVKGHMLNTVEDIAKMGATEPRIWPVTQGPANDGFPSWSPDAKRLIFLRNDYDTNRDGIVTPSDVGMIWAADVLEMQDAYASIQFTDPMSNFLSQSFNLKAIRWALPMTSGTKMAVQPWFGANNRIYFTSDLSGNYDIWSLPADGHIPRLDNAEKQFEIADETYPLPLRMQRLTLGPLFRNWKPATLKENERINLLDRIVAFQRVIDFHGSFCDHAAASLYEIGVCKKLLGFDQESQFFFDLILKYYSINRKDAAYAKMALLDYAVSGALSFNQRINTLKDGLNKIIAEYADQSTAVADAQIAIGDLCYESEKYSLAFAEYSKVQKKYPDEKSECAESQLKIGDVFKKFASQSEVVQAYLEVVKKYPEQRQWMVPARHRILNLLTEGLEKEKELIARYREIVGQYSEFGLLAAAAQLRIGNVLYSAEDYSAASKEFEAVELLFPAYTDEVFVAQMAEARCLLRLHESLKAFAMLEKMSNEYGTKRPDLKEQAEEALLDALLQSGDELKSLHDYELALARYRRAKSMDVRNVHAHRGYVECMYYLHKIDAVVAEYELLNKTIPQNNILIYTLGLAYSYQGTEKSELFNDPEALDPEILQRSSATIARALSYDFTLVQAYLTLAYNYEMMETYLARKNAKPKKVFVKTFEALTAPVVTVYRTLTFYEERKPARYYERAIHELSKALALNDEKQDRGLEANLALNLANNYYNLEEFGYQKAYEYYHLKLRYDSTFADQARQALIFERMGHCALITEDLDRGPKYFLRAIDYYRQKGEESKVLINLQRLALLYQIGNRNDMAIEYYQQAADIEKKSQYYNSLMRSYRNIAYNYLLLGEPKDAIQYAQKSLDLIEGNKVKKVKKKASRVKVGILGIFIPIPFLDLSDMGTTSSAQFTTKDEMAILYTILGTSLEKEKDYSGAIDYLKKKITLYDKRKDAAVVAAFLNNIGFLSYTKGEFASAFAYFKESIELCEKQKIEYGILTNTLNLARLALTRQELSRSVHSRQMQEADLNDDYSFAVKKVNAAITLANENIVRHHRTLCQLYYLFGKLSLVQMNVENAPDLTSRIHSTLASFENASYAQIYFNEALMLAVQWKLTEEECITRATLGELYLMMRDYVKSYDQLRQARRLALRHGFFDQLWRLNTQLGDLLSIMDSETKRHLSIQKDACEYYDEAIEILQKNPVKMSGAAAKLFRQETQKPYRHAVFYLSQKGDIHGALALAEQMHAQRYFDIMNNENLVLKKERHKIYYGNTKFLQSEINKLDIELLLARNQANVSVDQIVSAKKRREDYILEYQDLLEKMRKEVPGLESMIHVGPVRYDKVQERLLNNEKIIYLIHNDDWYLVWCISRSDISFAKISLSSGEIHNSVTSWLEGKNSNFDVLADLFSLLQVSDTQISHLIIIPDDDLIFLPWSAVVQCYFKQAISVVVSSSLTSYYYSFDNRKIPGQKFYTAQNIEKFLKNTEYDVKLPVQSKQSNSFPSQRTELELADFIALNLQCEWNENDPNRSRLGYRVKMSALAVFTPMSLYELSLGANLIQSNFEQDIGKSLNSETFLAFERACIYAGSPCILANLWPSPLKTDTLFSSIFYKKMQGNSAARALAETQEYLRQTGIPPREWAQYQLYGFGGMSPEESQRYATEGFENKVRKGHSAFDLGEWADAIRYYNEAYLMVAKQNDSKTRNLLRQRIIESAVNGGLWDAAIGIQKQIVLEAEKDNNIPAVASGYSNLAFFYTQNQQFMEGIEYKGKYTRLAEQYGLKEEEAKSLRETGLIFERGNSYGMAIDLFRQAEQRYKDLKLSAKQAQCLGDIGRIYFFYMDNFAEAIHYLQQAISLLQPQGASQELVTILNNCGLTFEKITNYRQALEYHQQALNYCRMMDNPLLIAQTKQYIANILWKMGDYEESLKIQDEAMSTFSKENAGDFLQVAFSTRGLIKFSLGQTTPALNDEMTALNLAIDKENQMNQATILKNIGMIQRSLGKVDLALDNFKQATAIDSTLSSKRSLAYDLRNISSIYAEMDSINVAHKFIHKALELSAKVNDWRNIVQSLIVLGQVEMKEGAKDSARVHFTRAASLAGQYFIPEIEWRALKELAKIFESEGKFSQAVQYYYNAVKVVEGMRSKIKVEEFSSGFVDDKLGVYGDLVLLLVNQNHIEEAFNVVERAKSRNFLDMLGNRKISFHAADAKIMSRVDSLKNSISQKQAELFYLHANKKDNRVSYQKKLEQDIAALENRYSECLIRIRQDNPELSEMMSVEPWPLAKIQAMLPKSAGLLEYYIYDNQIFIWFITPEETHFSKVNMNEQELVDDVTAFRKAIDRQLSITQWSKKLYQILIQPHEQNLNSVEHFAIVPHTILHYVPFAALQDAKDQYFGLEHSLSISPGATVLGFCMEKGEEFIGQDKRSFPVLAFGNPNLGSEKLALPFAEKEVKSLQRYYHTVSAFIENRASEKQFREYANYPPLVLMSCHGIFNEFNPLLSALLLTPDEEYDGRLEANEIFGFDMKTYIIAMSACETGLGTIRGGDEVIGLSRSFIYAGAASLMSSLWKVDDLATAVLIKRFFRYLAEGQSRAQALQNAQKIVFDEIDPYPAFWAAFMITGDFR